MNGWSHQKTLHLGVYGPFFYLYIISYQIKPLNDLVLLQLHIFFLHAMTFFVQVRSWFMGKNL